MNTDPIKIIIIDDNWDDNDPITVSLREKYQPENVLIKNTSRDGIKAIKEYIPQKLIVLLDLDLGAREPDGAQVFTEIRKETSLVYIIIITAKKLEDVRSEDLVKFINNDALAYISKTATTKEIVNIVEKAEHQLSTRVDCVLEQWLKNHSEEEMKKPYLKTTSGKTYSLENIMLEIRRQTDFGKEMERKILYLAIDLLKREKEEIND